MAKLDISKLKNEHDEHFINFEKLRNLIIKELEALLIENNVKLGFPVQSRIKNIDSIVEKHESQRYRIKQSLLELQDLIGIRIVLLFRRDIEVVSQLIKNNFNVRSNYDPADKLNYDQFGYSSKHYIVNIPDSWTNVPTNKNLNSYTVEIQIRTLSQHNWAETSNVLQYKNESNVPPEILRSIGRVSALLEIVDLELERTLQDRESYIAKTDYDRNPSEILNVDLLMSVLQKNIPNQYQKGNENYSQLLENLKSYSINTVSELEKLIKEYLDIAIKKDQEYFMKPNLSDLTTPYFNFVGMVRIMLENKNSKLAIWTKVK
ncbi:RelA/SpoT domain-containing protein [Chryseobacterium sp. L7]|uniref:RelA/SpoT domain-containing protein n=1 Tax=Chryseobacterium endalhagicum TaxID=2797638 RepID=A0ABS1QIV0_9FLAO|nr:RelA/SpoT domain-containing protein [Chryseobacterium endalhagicum]MBL1222562.1 RelA/SpoT domain-containing protein [Chryseobacterium endalhagicum]